MKRAIAIVLVAVIAASFLAIYPVHAQYRNYYSVSINVGFLETQRQRNPSFDSRNFVQYALTQIQSRYNIAFQYLKFDFDLNSATDYSLLLSQLNYYIPYFATYAPQRLIVQLSIIRQLHVTLTDSQLRTLYSGIASILNQYSNRIVVFAGENELEGNTTCPICGRIGGQEAFGGNVYNMIGYAQLLHDTWHLYSNIPFTHSAVAPWHETPYTVYGGFWFDEMSKVQYKDYINRTQDILAWTIWWNTDGAQYLGILRNELGKQVIVSEHNYYDPAHALGIMSNFGLQNLVAFNWYCLVGYDTQILYDWACSTHNLYKHSWFPMVKVPITTNPEGSYFCVLNTWHDLSLRGYQESYWYWASAISYAYRPISVTSTGYDAYEVFVNFEAVTKTDGAELEFLKAIASDGTYYNIGARVYTDRTFQFMFQYVQSDGTSIFTVLHDRKSLTEMNKWFRLTIYHTRGTITIMIDGQLWITQGNSYSGTKTLTTIRFGDLSTQAVATIYLDHVKIWTSTDGATWTLRFEERFENGLGNWYKVFSPTTQPSFIDTAKWDFYIDYPSLYSAYSIN